MRNMKFKISDTKDFRKINKKIKKQKSNKIDYDNMTAMDIVKLSSKERKNGRKGAN